MTTSAAPVLAINNIEVVYNKAVQVLRGLSLEVPRGGIVACWAATAPASPPR